jgi:FtsZ-binding cell division protein ZapB
MDNFEELESRIGRTIDLLKTTRQEKAQAEKELATARKQIDALEREVEQLRRERDVVKNKVESLIEMLSELTEETLV